MNVETTGSNSTTAIGMFSLCLWESEEINSCTHSAILRGKSGATVLNDFFLAHEMVLALTQQNSGYKKCNIFFKYSHSALWYKRS